MSELMVKLRMEGTFVSSQKELEEMIMRVRERCFNLSVNTGVTSSYLDSTYGYRLVRLKS
ncbi:hypothetical protein DPMN_065693 [Dreissena polymorpha]|uniref:Uncharacterized protein n=1 Tax=Dreissena polymorpha TaxID=45954 RepID=A0A9D4BUE4_DREPO|nr:hypothetical protein DPMN_065693 [Dreissena polymorpha]